MARIRARRRPDDMAIFGWIIIALIGALIVCLAGYLAFVHEFPKREAVPMILLVPLGLLGAGILFAGIHGAKKEAGGR